ncbi:reverse transcriptase domain-containing protein [Tanacetum coccineum]
MVSNQIRPPGFPPVQNPHANIQNNHSQNNFNRGNNVNQNRGNNFNQGQIYRPAVNQPVAHQGPAPQTHASTSGSGTLPGNTVTNPKEDLKGITTRSGVTIQGPKAVNHDTEVTKDTMPPANNGSTKDVQPPVVQIQSRNPNPEPNVLWIDKCNALADLGASINLMPYSVWNNLSLPELTPTCMTLELADRSITKPIGIAEDVFVNVGKFQFPADFVVVRLPFRVRTKRPSLNLTKLSNTQLFTTNDVKQIDVIGYSCDDDFLLMEEADSFLALEDDPTSSEVDPTYQDPEGDILLLEAILNSEPPPPLPNQEQTYLD